MVKQSPVGKQITYDALTAPVTNHDVAQLQAIYKDAKNAGLYSEVWVHVGVGFFTVIAVLALFANGLVPGIIGWFVALGVHAGAHVLFKKSLSQKARLMKFAADNGWQYWPRLANPTHQGLIFQIGHTKSSSSMIYNTSTESEVGFEIGNYQYTVGHGKNSRTYSWGYMSIELDRRVPHMLLDAKGNNASLFGMKLGSNLPMSFHKDQVLSLEGDFNKYFTLYAPHQYERDAYYIFTPDLMALLIDQTQQFDVEVIDNRLYVYASRPFNLHDPNMLYRLFMIIHTVGMKAHRQTDYYADERVADRTQNIVARDGARLKRGTAWASIITTIVFIVLYIVFQILSRV